MLGKIGQLLGGGILDGVNGIIKTVAGDKVQQEANRNTEAMAVHGGIVAEFGSRENRTWWDSLVDGLNRLPRPLMAFGVIALMAWPAFDPAGFAAAMQGYALMPEWMGEIILAVVFTYFVARSVEKVRIGKGPTKAQVAEVIETQKQIAGLRQAEPLEEDEYQAAMKDTTKPLPNRVIEEWNRRRQQQQG
jgi:hypothetical protein